MVFWGSQGFSSSPQWASFPGPKVPVLFESPVGKFPSAEGPSSLRVPSGQVSQGRLRKQWIPSTYLRKLSGEVRLSDSWNVLLDLPSSSQWIRLPKNVKVLTEELRRPASASSCLGLSWLSLAPISEMATRQGHNISGIPMCESPRGALRRSGFQCSLVSGNGLRYSKWQLVKATNLRKLFGEVRLSDSWNVLLDLPSSPQWIRLPKNVKVLTEELRRPASASS